MTEDDIKIKILVDNKANADLIKEHGFAAWIEAFGHKILFDTGQGKALIHNAASLGCDLSHADALVLSHGHFDHCGAISKVLKYNSSVRVYCHPEALVHRYSIHLESEPKVVSIPPTEGEALLSVPINRMHWVRSPKHIDQTIGITGTIPRLHPLEDTGGPFYLDPDRHRPDPINDDIGMWINTPRGVIIVVGCCHSGIINTVEYIQQISGDNRVLGIIGGLHLLNASHARLETTCTAFKKWAPKFIIPCHCTGDEAVAFMQKELGGKVIQGYAGLTWKIDNKASK